MGYVWPREKLATMILCLCFFFQSRHNPYPSKNFKNDYSLILKLLYRKGVHKTGCVRERYTFVPCHDLKKARDEDFIPCLVTSRLKICSVLIGIRMGWKVLNFFKIFY